LLIAPNRITCARAARRALLLLIACLALALTFAACGGGEESTGTEAVDTVVSEEEAERESDIDVLNGILDRQRTAIVSFDQLIAEMRGRPRALAVAIRTQEEEHAVGILRAMRALEGSEEVEVEASEPEPGLGEAERLTQIYESLSAIIDAELIAIERLNYTPARSLLAATAANQAQQLVLLRRALGAKPAEWVPAPFENGTTPAP